MTATVTTIFDAMSRKDLEKWAKRNLGIDRADLTQYETDNLRDYLASAAEEHGIDVAAADETPRWKLTLNVLPLRQLGHDCFVGSIKYRDINLVTVPADAQRDLKPSRVPKIAAYVTDNDGRIENGHVHAGYFPSVVVNISGSDIEVTPHTINVGESAKVEVSEGQHRVAGIRKAMEQGLSQDRLDDDLPCLFYVNLTLEEKRQAFADINANLVKPPKAISLAFNERNPQDELAKVVAREVFGDKVAANKTRIGPNDAEWFTLTSFVDAVAKMFDTPTTGENFNERVGAVSAYWSGIAQEMAPIWADKTFMAGNKNVLVAIGKLFGMNVDTSMLACLDWSQDGDVYRIIRDKGGTNAAVPAVEAHLKSKVVVD